MKDYYSILEVSKSATTEEIKKAYKLLSLKYHPDRPNGDVEKFKELTLAYEILSDSQKKHIYDSGQDPNNMGNQQHFNSNDIFQQFFGGNPFGGNPFEHHHNQQIKRGNFTHIINISLKDAHTGISKTVKINVKKVCFDCKIKCKSCNGTRFMNIQNGPFIMKQHCNACSTGYHNNNYNANCTYCKGTFEKNEDKICKIDIPRCVDNGNIIVLEGLGEQIHKQNEIPGDLHFKININSDPNFTRQHNNLIYQVNLTFKESIIGKMITIPHFDGDINMITDGFGVINPQQTYSLKGKGLGAIGDLVLNFQITYPGVYPKEIIEQFKLLNF
jgi:molecular chaperone DnaJ